MTIFLVRHGEIENKAGILSCRLPGFHLSKEGRKRIKEVGSEFLSVGFNPVKIYTSPLERTIETAQILADILEINRENIIKEENIIETNCGDWEGKSETSFKLANKDFLNKPIVEPIQSAGKRLFDFINNLPHSIKDGNIIIVSHGDLIMGAVAIIKNDWQVVHDYMRKGDFYKLEFSNKWLVEERNKL